MDQMPRRTQVTAPFEIPLFALTDSFDFDSFVGTTCRGVYGPYDPFLATSLVQQAVAAGNIAGVAAAGVTDPRLQVKTVLINFVG
jgi:hypothetical protein